MNPKTAETLVKVSGIVWILGAVILNPSAGLLMEAVAAVLALIGLIFVRSTFLRIAAALILLLIIATAVRLYSEHITFTDQISKLRQESAARAKAEAAKDKMAPPPPVQEKK